MKWTILGSGGCTVTPRPLCQCHICQEARERGIPYSRTGPAIFLHDLNLLIDTPAEVVSQLNRADIRQVDYLTLTHLDPDHVEGLRVVEQIALDFRTWRACPDKQLRLLLPEEMEKRLRSICFQYGSVIDFYEKRGFVELKPFKTTVRIGEISLTALPVDRGSQVAFIYVFAGSGRRVVYAPCDIKPFPELRGEVRQADLLIIQPGIFEDGLRHGFQYPDDHISRTTLYTFEQTIALARRIEAQKVLFVHLEEYWNRSYDDYLALEPEDGWYQFAWDGMQVTV